jgi:hypothetical protein
MLHYRMVLVKRRCDSRSAHERVAGWRCSNVLVVDVVAVGVVVVVVVWWENWTHFFLVVALVRKHREQYGQDCDGLKESEQNL